MPIEVKIGCSAEALRKGVRQFQIDAGWQGAVTNADQARIRESEREARTLWRANDILRMALACFDQAGLDRQQKRWRRLSTRISTPAGSS